MKCDPVFPTDLFIPLTVMMLLSLIKRLIQYVSKFATAVEIFSAVLGTLSQLALWHPKTLAKVLPIVSEGQIQSFSDNHPCYLVWTPLGLLILGIVLRVIRGHYINELEEEKANIEDELQKMQVIKDNVGLLLTRYLIAISRDLKFTVDERVSLYVLRKNKAHKTSFALIGRFSDSDTLKQPGRDTYPFGEGVIGEAWDKGECEASNLPDWESNRNEYVNISKISYKLKSKTVNKLTMHPRYLFGLRIASEDNTKYDSVIIIESKAPNFGSSGLVKPVLLEYRPHLYSFVSDLRDAIPALSKARERGF